MQSQGGVEEICQGGHVPLPCGPWAQHHILIPSKERKAGSSGWEQADLYLSLTVTHLGQAWLSSRVHHWGQVAWAWMGVLGRWVGSPSRPVLSSCPHCEAS